MTPKGETELTAEEKLIRAIFKEKARGESSRHLVEGPHGEAARSSTSERRSSRDAGDDLSPRVNEL